MKTEAIHPYVKALGKDESGTIRIGGTRVTLDTVVEAYERGATPESIVSQHDVLTLPQVYETISYYLNHREEADAYLEERKEQAKAVRKKLEEAGVASNMGEVRERLMRRMAEDEKSIKKQHET